MILVIDNYDSFTYNLVQYLGELGEDLLVVRNDELAVEDVERMAPERIVISPGPGTPDDGGISVRLIETMAGKIPILGVCLGHQCIAVAYGGKVVRAPRLMHGKTSSVRHDGRGVYRGLPNPFTATRYHSLIVEESSLPRQLTATAHTEEGELMGIRHTELEVEGVQFHPESFLTGPGKQLLANFALGVPGAA